MQRGTLPPCQLLLVALSGAVVLWRIAPVINVSVLMCHVLLPVRTHQPALSQGTWQGPCAVCFEGETRGFCFLCVTRLPVQMCVPASGVIPQELSTGVFHVIAFVYFCVCVHMYVCRCTCHSAHLPCGSRYQTQLCRPDGPCFCPPRHLASLPP